MVPLSPSPTAGLRTSDRTRCLSIEFSAFVSGRSDDNEAAKVKLWRMLNQRATRYRQIGKTDRCLGLNQEIRLLVTVRHQSLVPAVVDSASSWVGGREHSLSAFMERECGLSLTGVLEKYAAYIHEQKKKIKLS